MGGSTQNSASAANLTVNKAQSQNGSDAQYAADTKWQNYDCEITNKVGRNIT